MANLLSALNFKLVKNILKDYKIIVILELQGMKISTKRPFCTLLVHTQWTHAHWKIPFSHTWFHRCGTFPCHMPGTAHSGKGRSRTELLLVFKDISSTCIWRKKCPTFIRSWAFWFLIPHILIALGNVPAWSPYPEIYFSYFFHYLSMSWPKKHLQGLLLISCCSGLVNGVTGLLPQQ